ncbi:MAG: DNA repair protein RadC [Burkholderiales bacterium]|nr:DNA repair protein RadC [Burkholderiales bacterium]
MAIKDWPEGEQPREKLLSLGAQALSDAELIAIFLRTSGVAGKSAIDVARELKERFRSLNGLFAASQDAVSAVPGMGVAKYVMLQAVMEMARRALRESMDHADVLSTPEAVKSYLRLKLQNLSREVFVVIFVDAQNRVLALEELFAGTLTQTSVYPREVVKQALTHNAAAVIFAHNHPSGVAEPSQADEDLTRVLRQALALIDVRVLDHFVVGRGGAMSFAERGLL